MNMRHPRTLSKSTCGYVLALLVRTIGAPIGWVTSPLTLFILNRTLKGSADKRPNRFLVWSLIGISGAPISLAISLATLYLFFPHGTYDTEARVVNRSKFEQIQAGMTIKEVESIVGDAGEVLGEDDASGGETYVFGDRTEEVSIETIFKEGKLIR